MFHTTTRPKRQEFRHRPKAPDSGGLQVDISEAPQVPPSPVFRYDRRRNLGALPGKVSSRQTALWDDPRTFLLDTQEVGGSSLLSPTRPTNDLGQIITHLEKLERLPSAGVLVHFVEKWS
jgi:hypothetical protein